MVLSRGWSIFLVLVGGWNWVIWPRFAVAIWNDPRSFAGSSPTSFLIVHVLLIGTSVVIGTIVGVYGIRGFLAARAARRRSG